MLAIFLMMLAAAVTARMIYYLAGEVAFRMGHERKVGYQAAASAGLSLIATPRKRT